MPQRMCLNLLELHEKTDINLHQSGAEQLLRHLSYTLEAADHGPFVRNLVECFSEDPRRFLPESNPGQPLYR